MLLIPYLCNYITRSATKKYTRTSLKNDVLIFKCYEPDHRRAFERNTPPVHVYVLREAHGLEHLRAKHAAVPHLNPLVQHRMERENLKGRLDNSTTIRISARLPPNITRLRVWVVCGLKANVLDSHLAEEHSHES
jgi:hypothetical protein